MNKTATTIAMMTLTSLSTGHAAVSENFGSDVDFLAKHIEVVVLSSDSGSAQVAVVPAWQGRVMTSTAHGRGGDSFGWINRALIAAGTVQPHINVYGGEDRFWLGPEGGQFSIFFAPGATFDLKHWQTPAFIDTEPFEIVSKAKDHVTTRRAVAFKNYSAAEFFLEITRTVRLLDANLAIQDAGASLPKGLSVVAYESENTVKNAGKSAWRKDTGLLSIWILGMFNASPEATAVIPYRGGPEAELGPVVNDTYFGKVPVDRLVAGEGVLFFRADARYRSKIGISPPRAKRVLGSYDAASCTLTLVTFTLPAGAKDYVNSMWEIQKQPYAGDVVNSYNDDGKLGNFFELETSSPALALQPGETATHFHRTIHIQGDESAMDAISRAALGASLQSIKGAFAGR